MKIYTISSYNYDYEEYSVSGDFYSSFEKVKEVLKNYIEKHNSSVVSDEYKYVMEGDSGTIFRKGGDEKFIQIFNLIE